MNALTRVQETEPPVVCPSSRCARSTSRCCSAPGGHVPAEVAAPPTWMPIKRTLHLCAAWGLWLKMALGDGRQQVAPFGGPFQ